MSVRFSIDYANRQVGCKMCENKIDKDMLRMGRRAGEGSTVYYHPVCLFASFRKAKAATKTIQCLPDIVGIEGLSQADHLTVFQLVADWIQFSSRQQLAKAGTGVDTAHNSPPVLGGLGGRPTVGANGPKKIGKATQIPSPRAPPPGLGGQTGQVVVVSDDDDGDDKENDNRGQRKKRKTETAPARVQQHLGINSNIQEDECSVCLELPVHPVSLPCSHTYCFLCAKNYNICKGLVRTADDSGPLCSLCRRPFPFDYLDSAEVVARASVDLGQASSPEVSDVQWQWFYQGKAGWWKFEERNNAELEKSFREGQQLMEMLICGNIYIINFLSMEQYQKNYPTRRRRIKRDVMSSDCRGVAGLQAAPGNWSHNKAS